MAENNASLFMGIKAGTSFFAILSYLKKKLWLLFFLFMGIYNIHSQNCSVNAGIDETICGDVTSYNLSGSSSGDISSSTVWSQIAGPAVNIGDPNDMETVITGMLGGNTYTFQLSAICGDGVTVSQTVNISVEEITIANAGTDVTSCPDNSGGVIITGNTPANPGETGTWSIVGNNGAGVTINNATAPNTALSLAQGSAGTTTLRWTITGPEYALGVRCETYDEITITNYGGVEPVDAGPDQVLNSCYTVSQSTTLNGSFAGNGTGGQQGTWTFVSGTREPTIVSPNDNNTQVTGLFEGTYVFRWTVSGPCVNGSDTVTVTVDGASQDVTQATVQNRNQVFCDPSVTQTTLIGNEPDYAGETVLWRQTSGPPATITNPTSPTTAVTGLSYNNTYQFNYTIINETTGCSTATNVTVSYSDNNLSIDVNNGMDIIGECGQEVISIPFSTTGEGVNEYSIISGPPLAYSYPSDYQSFPNSSPLELTFEQSGTYKVSFRRRVTGDILSECDIATDQLNITISKAPTPANGGTNQVLACGVVFTELTGNNVDSGKSVWTQLIGPNQANIVNPFQRITGVTGLIPGIYVFRYTVNTAGGVCNSDTSVQSDVTVTVSDEIIDDDVDAGPDQTGICTGIEVQMEAATPLDGQTGTWTQVADAAPQTIVFENVNDPNTIATGFDDNNTTYTLLWTVENSASDCTTTGSDEVQITTSDTAGPTQADAGPDRCYSSGTSEISLEGNTPEILRETGLWTVSPAGPTFADATDPNTTVAISNDGEYTFTWIISPRIGGCIPTEDDVLIVIDGEATADAGPDQTSCASTFTMAASSSNGEGEWTQVVGPGGYTIADSTNPTTDITFTYSGTYIFEWTVSAGECSLASDQVELNVGLPPTQADAGPDQSICNGSNTVTLAANAYDGDTETGTWIIGEGATNTPTITDPTDPNTTVTGLITGTYTFIWSIKRDPNCEESSDEVQVTIGTPANAGADQNLCNATNVFLKAEEGSTGTWTQVSTTGSNAVIVQSPENSYIANAQIEPGTDYVFRFTTDTPGCVTSDDMTVVNTGPPAYSPIAGDDQNLCQGDLIPTNTYILGANLPPSGVTAEWRIAFQPEGGVATITDPSIPNTSITGLDVPGFYILEWNFSAGNCTTESDVVRLTVFPSPSQADAGPNQSNACILTAQMNAVAPTAGVGEWSFESDPSGGDAIIDSPNSPTTTISNITALGTYTLKWTVVTGPFHAPSNCAPTEDTVDITFTDDPPIVADAGDDQEICLIAPATSTTTILDAGDIPTDDTTVGTWTVVSGPNTPTFGNVNNANTSVLDLIAGEYELMWTTEKGGCSDQDTMTITVYNSPTTADAGPNQTIAEFTPLIMAANSPTVGVGLWSMLEGPTVAVFTNPGNPSSSVANLTKGTYYFTWTITNGVCASSSDVVRVDIIGSADLELTKSVSPGTASPGDVVTFTIDVFNNNVSGTSDATGVSVGDLIPNGYTLVPNTITNGGVYYSGNLAILWEDLEVALGETLTLQFQATVNKTGDYENRALITASDQIDPDSDSATGFDTDDLSDGITDDDEDSVTVTVESADLELTKSANVSEANIGEEVTFRLDLLNNGSGSASEISVKDTIPDGYTFVTGSASNGGIYNTGDNSITWSNISLNSGYTQALLYRATPNTTGTNYTNVAEITNSSNNDPDSDPNSSTDVDDLNDGIADDDETELTVPITQTDLSLSKTVSNASPNIGETVTFNLSVTNESTTDATNVAVQDYVPNGFNIVSVDANASFIGKTVTWTGFTVPAGGTVSGSFTAEVLAPQGTVNEYLNTAQITAMDQVDSDSTPNNDDGDQSEDDEDNALVTPQAADLSITKDVNDNNPEVGDIVTFTVVVTNDGSSNATGVEIVDVLPVGYTLETVTGGTASGNTATWLNQSIASGGTLTLNYTATVNSGMGGLLDHTNTVQITASDQFDPDSTPNNNKPTEDDQALVNVTLAGTFVDIEVTKEYSPTGIANPGSTITFTITAANTSTNDATGVVVTDLVRAGYTITGTNPSVGTYNTGNGAWDIGNLIAGQSETLTITVNVIANPDPEQYINIAQVTGLNENDIDSTPSNNDPTEDDQDQVNPSVEPLVDLNLSKTVNIPDPEVNTDVIFTLTILNEGVTTAPGVEITDILPSGYTFVNATTTDGTYDDGTGVWTLSNNLGVNKTETLQIEATVNVTGDYLNTAEVTASDFPDADSTPANGDIDEDDYAEASVTPIPLIDLSLTKSVDNLTPNIGDDVIFTLNVTNDGPSDATNVEVKDLLPAGLEYVSDNSGGAYDETTGIWTVGSIPLGATSTIEITAEVLLYEDPLPTADYLNIAEVFSADEEDTDSTPNNADDSEDDQAEVQITPNPTLVDLEVTKAVDNLTPVVGENVTFTVTITNNDNNPPETIVGATSVVVSDKLSTGYTFVSANASTGTYTENSGSWVIGDLAAGGTETLNIVVTVNATGNYANTAQVTDQDQPDLDSEPSNNDDTEDDYATIVVTPQFPADLALTKSVNVTTQDVGALVSFTVTITNNGPAIASGVEVTDLLPSGYTFVGANGPGTFNGTTGVWSIGQDIPVGATVNGIIVARVNATGDYLNTAEITAADQTDPDTTNNSDDAEVTPNTLIDLSLNKLVSKLLPDVGEEITFSLALTNDGPNEATNVEVTDLLPDGYTFVSSSGDGTYTDGTGIWSLPSLGAGETVFLQLNVTVNTAGTYLNTAEVTAADQQDVDSQPADGTGDDFAQMAVVPRMPTDIEVVKTVDDDTPGIGDEINYTITVYNNPNGGANISDATGVSVRDILPSGLSFVSASASVGDYDDAVGTWNIDNLANGATVTLTITARVRALGNYTNTAELIAADASDPDSTPGNGVEAEDDQSTVIITPVDNADLMLTKTVGNSTPNVGDNIQFILTVENQGPGIATGVSVTDVLPVGFTYIGSTATNGTYNSGTGVWDISTPILSGGSQTLTIVASVNASAGTANEYLNTSEITASDNTDPDSTPNNGDTSEDDYAEVLVTPASVIDLSVEKEVNVLRPDTGDEIIFTLTIENAGPSTATGVQVTDLIPDGYTYVSDDSAGLYDSTTGIWDVGTLTSGTSMIMNITVSVNSTGTYVNIAEVTAVNETDADSTPANGDADEDDQDQAQTLPRVTVDIEVEKTVNIQEPQTGDEIVFTIVTLNNGPSDATGVVVNDLLPSGYEFVSAVTIAGTYDEVTGGWNIGSLAENDLVTLEITATVLESGQYANTAELVALDQTDSDSTPNNNVEDEDDQSTVSPFPSGLADLSITKEVDNESPNIGDDVQFVIHLLNSGDSDATGVEVTDLLPAGFTYKSYFTTAGVYNPSTGVWRLNNIISKGETETLNITATVGAPTGNVEDFTNRVEITASDVDDPDSDPNTGFDVDDFNDGIPDDDEASVVVGPLSVDIGMEKTVDNETPSIGEQVVFTVTATNNSTTEATNIGIEDALPAGYEYVSNIPSSGIYDEANDIWTIPSIAGNSSATLQITVKVLDVNDYVNVASLAYVDQMDINPDNDRAEATIDPGCLTIFNEFSPNGDNINEFFHIDCISQYPNNRLEVYNRWGSLVHAEDGYNNDWDGTTDGKTTDKVLPTGTYYYILDLGDGSEPKTGWLYINK
ncbi:PKD domain-containing protein [Galbibacter pacificus]|uniref:Gliding motility-associated C-terminal domain-containing protein n=1 Tax=Galbibacter pacificus TaxID=2996052 RepID=A0ABT6FRA0_9FLAO|nr:gliding motility-associated C-terminal domain-containing protein [Galbibacter pacificus]MDG3581874.1 gliding motility-associated C-terminal domain-containing protein [Galbibacter pacificus]MDG3585652.1 gliding motility-associated C-terminal domain-containing protein [Galbibacter pacificus]